MTVSVIIPCYRNAATLGRALDSVYAQTRPADEIIVVNDGSPETDAIELVLQGYRNVKYLRNPVNMGPSVTRNNGVETASGDIVTFLDADDEWHPQKLELQLSVLREGSAAACGVLRVRGAEKPAARSCYTGIVPVRSVTRVGSLLFRNSLTGAAIMISRKLLLRVGGYDATLRSGEDFDLWLRLLQSGVTVHNIRWPLYIYHYNEGGLSNNFPNISYWELEALKKYYSRKGGVFLQSRQDAIIWAFWMCRHLARYEICGDATLKHRTMQNIALLSKHPVLRGLITLADRSSILRLYAALRRRK